MGSEEKKRSMEAKQRGDEAFKRKDYQTAIDAYTQVSFFVSYFFLLELYDVWIFTFYFK